MNFLLVGFTFLVLACVAVGIAMLGSDRLFPARKVFEYVAEDGIEPVSGGEPPLILSERPDAQELTRIRFATAVGGYNRAEVDGVLTRLIAENQRLRTELAQVQGVPASSQPLPGADSQDS